MAQHGVKVGVIVASGGSTNAGVIDDLDGVATVAESLGAWLHVDGAYGLAALLLDEFKPRLSGLHRANSFIVDPHKWLFSTGGSCALLYRDPRPARTCHTQKGPYIEVLHTEDDAWNPCDMGFQLTRRASGLPTWFNLAVHGTKVFEAAIRRGVELVFFLFF